MDSFHPNIHPPKMDPEKAPQTQMLTLTPTRRARPLTLGFLAVALCYLLYSHAPPQLFLPCHGSTTAASHAPLELQDTQVTPALEAADVSGVQVDLRGLGQGQAPLVMGAEKTRVPLEAHIMSKCPDAKVCLQELVLPAMQRVVEKVDFTLSFIGTPTDNDGVACKHGPEECLGNIIELCAASMYPDPKIYLGFTMCLTKDYKDIPQKSLVEDCAMEFGLDIKELDECAVRDDGGFGMGMLRESVARSTKAGVTKSCTVRLDNEIYCIHDGDWNSCPNGPGVNDLVIAVEKLYQSS